MSLHPLYYCAPDVAKPVHCAHAHHFRAQDGKGPDGKTGIFYGPGGDIPAGLDWKETPEGWWFAIGNQRPQDLIRLHTSPRIVRWHAMYGVEKGQAWRIPVLLEPLKADDPDQGYISALDRIWRGGEYGTPQDLKDAQVALLHIALGVELADTPEARNAALVDLVVKLLSLGHHVSRHEIIAKGWLSEKLIQDIPLLAMDRHDLTITEQALPGA